MKLWCTITGSSMYGILNGSIFQSWLKIQCLYILMYQLSSLGPHAGKQVIQFQCDILNLVLAINKDSVKDTMVMH